MNEAETISASTHGSQVSSKIPTSPSPSPKSPSHTSVVQDQDQEEGNKDNLAVKSPEVVAEPAAATLPEISGSESKEPQVESDTKDLKGPEPQAESTDPISSLEKITNEQLRSDSSSLPNSVVIATAEENRKDS